MGCVLITLNCLPFSEETIPFPAVPTAHKNIHSTFIYLLNWKGKFALFF